MRKKVADEITISRDGFLFIKEVRKLNNLVFREKRLINRLDHDPLIFLTAHCQGELAGFKIGYAQSPRIFYSAKGATSPLYRRQGVATKLLFEMMREAAAMGFTELHYDTFPAIYPGMVVLGLRHGYKFKKMHWNPEYNDFQLRLGRALR
ncbi:GNAT family N-acetyltransferase [Natronogracilivirga saccharolytica]|uniref:GNAT family N-acetyltransferase n=1 Tax=Natronogracilivirga saccharolytica TaxID=2812953 RepID=A0A8J7RFW7_9BACT|nr:GNAT family N-acetyltransferase [Natronogracilivirga saccharolytica]MBP3191170.1 GNAT family N-acetyltransferase [Natronogracilivirga saccharolytica]